MGASPQKAQDAFYLVPLWLENTNIQYGQIVDGNWKAF